MDGMPGTVETGVLIVSGGPVGMTLALDLANSRFENHGLIGLFV